MKKVINVLSIPNAKNRVGNTDISNGKGILSYLMKTKRNKLLVLLKKI